jgi:hypothetical protein
MKECPFCGELYEKEEEYQKCLDECGKKEADYISSFT